MCCLSPFASAGALIFGVLGDRIGRTHALGISIFWSEAGDGRAYNAQNSDQRS